MSWGASEEAKPHGGDAGSTIDDECQAWWVRIRKFLGILVTDTSDVALGAGADEDNPAIKDAFVDATTIEKVSETQIGVKDAGIDETKIVSTALGAGLTGGSGTTLSVDGIVETGTGSHEMKCKVIDMGDWNMDTTAQLNVAHGLGASFKKIRSVSGIIRDDDDVNYYNISKAAGAADYEMQAFIGKIDTTNVAVSRKGSGDFDNVLFNSTSFNRGWIMVWYEV